MRITSAMTLNGTKVHSDKLPSGAEYFSEFDLTRSAEEEVEVVDQIAGFLYLNKGDHLCITLPGNRGPLTFAERFHVGDRGVFCKDRAGQCIRASIANAICASSGAQEASRFLHRGSVVVGSLKDCLLYTSPSPRDA